MSVSLLKRRGWTPELMRELLPKPRYFMKGGHPARVWAREDVLEAEENPRFKNRKREPAQSQSKGPTPGTKKALGLLSRAWDGAGNDGSPAWRLAEHYHRAVVSRLPAVSKSQMLRASQATAWINEFLALEQRCESRQLPGVLKNFLRAGPWMGEYDSHPLVAEVCARYTATLLAAARQAASDFTEAQPEADLMGMLQAKGFPLKMLLSEGLATVWSVWYVPQAIRTSLSLLIALNPKDEYPEARSLHRKFILHLGGTNTGKTYAGFQRLKRARTGVYLAPLRLLALEAQETLLSAGVDCSLSTGEEEDLREGDTHIAATAEKLNLKEHYEAAVIDECQMIADPQRGYAWTRAILGVLAPEVHLCAAPEAKDLLIRLIDSCGDSWEVEVHERTTPLICMGHTVDYQRVQPGDALITFSKVGVLSVAEDLRQSGKEPAIIYGALPYATRRKQMEGFLEGKMEYIVSTDAIGMGLNLPIRRVIFMETEKFDGVERRELKPEEIKQIAGRAGRFGMYNRGFVGATQNLPLIRAGLEAVVPPLEYAVAGFSDLVLQVDFDLLEVLTQWNQMPTVEPYRKLDVSRYITIISKLREMGFVLTREQELRAANIPFDETEDALRELFFHLLQRWQQGEAVEQPGLPEEDATLPELELYYKKLDLYFSFAKAFSCPVDEDKLYDSRERVADEINEILLYKLRSNIRFCARCGKALPLHHRGRLCDGCYRKVDGGRRRGH
ncbi:helicase-related protein [Colidextribacter sp. OB.20]|uniref:helicase-related protein n=1 Tax=Colidextribacter sp. OB.20 TaxID=2304568 RepID=UPI00136B9414|nr:helicase-related protein [Colidextribacter sp. OB.20]